MENQVKVNILRKGDSVIGVTQEFVAVRRKNGETDIFGLIVGKDGIRIDFDRVLTIGFGEMTVEYETDNGIVVTNF